MPTTHFSPARSSANYSKSTRLSAFIASALALTVLSGCGKQNPLMGDWHLTTGICFADGLTFTEKTYSISEKGATSPFKTVSATYDFEDDKIIVKMEDGSLVFQRISDGTIRMLGGGSECIYKKL